MTYCPRCMKQHLQPDSVHTCTPHPAAEELERLRAENQRLREALIRLRDCDWVISLPDRMDAVRDIARAALEVGK